MMRVDPQNPRAVDLARRLERLLDPTSLPQDLCLVLGGDGMMLRTLRDLDPRLVFLGLNCGRVGFLMNDVTTVEDVAVRLTGGLWDVHTLPRLRLSALLLEEDAQGEPRRVQATALNDVYVERTTSQTCHLRLWIDGIAVVERLVCDGIVVATALGSTAYSMSAGGPACHAGVPSLHVTPICAFSPRLPPMSLPLSTRVRIEPLHPRRRRVRAVADGLGTPPVVDIEVEDAASDARIAFFTGHDFTATLFRKVLRA
ncbi:MAG: NAD(+)/NADH kinase [Deltaproteobacteria bacterium]|nr:NAD(+)/NADH kinase [Deltaproteobacteria bacterium]